MLCLKNRNSDETRSAKAKTRKTFVCHWFWYLHSTEKVTYLNFGKFGSTGTKYSVMFISVNRGVKYHVAISSAMLVRHTFHGKTFCGMKVTGLFLFADLENNLNIPKKNFKNACAKKSKSLVNCQMLENVSLLALTDFARRSCKVSWTMTLVYSIFHFASSPIFARVMIAFIYIYKERKKGKKRQASCSVAERLKFGLGKVKRKSRFFVVAWKALFLCDKKKRIHFSSLVLIVRVGNLWCVHLIQPP